MNNYMPVRVVEYRTYNTNNTTKSYEYSDNTYSDININNFIYVAAWLREEFGEIQPLAGEASEIIATPQA